VDDQRKRMNFPSAHPLHNTGNLGNSDLILALEVEDIFMLTHRMSPINRIGLDSPVKLTHNGAQHLEPGTVRALELSGFCALQRSGHGDGGRRRGWCGHEAHADLNARENIRQEPL
jgi:hypothetical protein